MAGGASNPDPKNAGGKAAPGSGVGGGVGGGKLPPLKQVWPIPALVLSAGLFVGGLVMVVATKPAPNVAKPLEVAKQLVERNKFDEAIAYLNSDVLPVMDHSTPTDAQRRDFFLTRARAFFGAQGELGISREENNTLISEDYERFEKLGGELDASDISRLAETKLAMDKTGAALDLVKRLPEAETARRTRLLRAIVESNLKRDRDPVREQQTLDLLASMATAPDMSPGESAWVLARQAELLLHAGRHEEAAEKIVRRLGKLSELSPKQQGELRLLLGKAYFLGDESVNAGKHLDAALEYLPEGDPLRAEAGVMLGRLAQAQGQLDRAKELYEGVRRDFTVNPALPRALLGMAEVYAADRDDSESQRQSLEDYAELVERVGREGGRVGEVTRELVTDSLMRRYTERFDSGRKTDALRFAQLAESLYKESQVPPAVLLGIGRARRDLADEALEQARAGRDADFSVQDMDQATRAEVKQHYLAAGDYLKRHAMSTIVSDGAMSGDSLWLAADSFDRGGDLDEAKKAFAQYADGAPDNDPKKPEAKFRLAQVFQAMSDVTAASALYSELAESRTRGGAIAQAGVWGERSIVPLATCLVKEGSAEKRTQAEELLKSVVDGSIFSPDAAGYRDALVELGTLYYTNGRYAEAIARLEQAVERYPDDRRIETIRFRLADANRLEAASIKKTLESGALPQSQVDDLMAARTERLRSAKSLFERVRAGLDERDRRKLTSLDRVYLRNAQFYAGDCAFELGDYDGAIQAYDAARLKYADEPASLVAMVQIVAAYTAQGKFSEARTANERARQQLGKFPEQAWSNPDLPMERKHWERWLDARTQLEQRTRGQEQE